MTDPHIVLICLDTVRKDFYDKYAIRLRERSTLRFEEMRAASSWSVPSHASMVTGKLPHQTGVHAYNRNFNTFSDSDTWFGSLEGYRTSCISANIYAGPAFGFDTLFDSCTAISPSRRFPEGLDVDMHVQDRGDDDGVLAFLKAIKEHDHSMKSLANGGLFKLQTYLQELPVPNPLDYGAKSITRSIRADLQQTNEPTFLFANFMDAHGPHSPFLGLDRGLYECPYSFTSLSFKDWDVNTTEGQEPYREQIKYVRQLYAAEIAYLDRIIAGMIDSLREELQREVIFVITADHGENLCYPADDHLMNHVASLSEALLHVPFDICSPLHEGTVSKLATHLDLGQIITRLGAGKPVDKLTRATACAEIAGSGSGTPDDDKQYWDRTQRAVYANERKYVLDSLGNSFTYDVSGDASTQRYLEDAAIPDMVFGEHFDNSIEDFARQSKHEQARSKPEITTGMERRLQDLGYL